MPARMPRAIDPLRPPAEVAAEAWAARVRASRQQLERVRELDRPADLYDACARRFGRDPHRTDDSALEVLRAMARPGETWLDIGAGGGRYALPLAFVTARVLAVDPSPAMLEVLRDGLMRYDVANVEIIEAAWPLQPTPSADVALMAHVGYDIEDFAGFLDAAEAAAGRCVVIMRASAAARASHALWPEVHGEPRLDYPMLPELLTLLVARGTVPEVRLVERGDWGFDSLEQLIEASVRLMRLRPDGEKARLVERLVREQATERAGQWEFAWTPMSDGVVSWSSP